MASAVGCEKGYCVDSGGQRIEASPVTSCDPMALRYVPVTLGFVLGVGKDAAGTRYMADEAPGTSTTRVFISDGDALVRRRTSGSGSSGGHEDGDYTISYENEPPRALLVQRRNNEVTAMGLGPGGKDFIGTPGAVDEELTVVDASSIADAKLTNLPGEQTIEYVADVDDGTSIVVTRPTDDWTYDDFRLFYGTGSALTERTVVSVSRTRSGGTSIRFLVGSKEYQVDFIWIIEPTDGGISGHSEPGTLNPGDGASRTVTERDPKPADLAGFTFACLK